MIKLQSSPLQLTDLKSPKEHVIDISRDFTPEEIDFFENIGMEHIAKGKIGVIVNVSGFQDDLSLPSPKCMDKFELGRTYTIIEFFIKKLQALGERAVRIKGKGYNSKREPILLLIQSNEQQIEVIDKYLTENTFFGYTGVICFNTVFSELRIANNAKGR